MTKLHNVRVLPDAAAVAAAAVVEIVRFADEAAVAASVRHLCLAGGTTPRMLYQGLPAGLDLRAVELWFSDERMVPADHAESNFAMVQQAFLSRATYRPRVVHRIAGERGAVAAAAAMNIAFGSTSQIDLVLLGVGVDGHTASLFPGDAGFDHIAPPAFVTARDNARVSASFTTLAAARQVIFVVTGEAKADILADLPCSDLPAAQLARALGDRAHWLLDAAAARRLLG